MNLKLPKFSASSSSAFKYGDRLNPARDWAIIISIVTLLLAVSLAWNVWLFLRVTNGDAIGTAIAPAALNPASTGSVDALFKQRADTETQYKNAHFSDPSVSGTAPVVSSTTKPVVDPTVPAS